MAKYIITKEQSRILLTCGPASPREPSRPSRPLNVKRFIDYHRKLLSTIKKGNDTTSNQFLLFPQTKSKFKFSLEINEPRCK